MLALAQSAITWIGFWNASDEWAWSDGTQVDYIDWAPGEPSGDGSCAEFFYFYNMRWNDRSCDGDGLAFPVTQYLCKVGANQP